MKYICKWCKGDSKKGYLVINEIKTSFPSEEERLFTRKHAETVHGGSIDDWYDSGWDMEPDAQDMERMSRTFEEWQKRTNGSEMFLQCNTCKAVLRGMDEANNHCEKTGHDRNFGMAWPKSDNILNEIVERETLKDEYTGLTRNGR